MEQGEEEDRQDHRKVAGCCNSPWHSEAEIHGTGEADYEYENIALLYGIAEKTTIPVLKEIYPTMWQRIISYAILRNIQPLPMKSIHYQYEKTYL